MTKQIQNEEWMDLEKIETDPQEKFQIPKLGNSCKFSQFRDNIGVKLGTKLPKLGKFWEVNPLLRSQKRDFFGTI